MGWAADYADLIDPLIRAAHPQEKAPAPVNTLVTQLDVTTTLRQVLDRLGTKDTDELSKVSEEQVRQGCEKGHGRTWNEITRVLESLGYDVAKRKAAYAWA